MGQWPCNPYHRFAQSGGHTVTRVETKEFLIPVSSTSEVSTTLKLGRGKCTGINILVPQGHNRLTTLQVLWQGRQIFPSLGQRVIGNSTEYFVLFEFFTQGGNDELALLGTNSDTYFSHRYIVRATMEDIPTSNSNVFHSGKLGNIFRGVFNARRQ